MDAQVQAKLLELAPYGAAWTAAFFVARFALFPKRSADFGNRVVSIVHALAAIALAVPALDWAAPMASVGQRNTAAQVRRAPAGRGGARRRNPDANAMPRTAAQARCMEVSLAYFIYDLLCCLFIDLDPVSLAHHVCTIAGLAVGVFQGKARGARRGGRSGPGCRARAATDARRTAAVSRDADAQCGTELVGCLMLMEVSNPSMHLNQLLKELGKSSSALATANQARRARGATC